MSACELWKRNLIKGLSFCVPPRTELRISPVRFPYSSKHWPSRCLTPRTMISHFDRTSSVKNAGIGTCSAFLTPIAASDRDFNELSLTSESKINRLTTLRDWQLWMLMHGHRMGTPRSSLAFSLAFPFAMPTRTSVLPRCRFEIRDPGQQASPGKAD